MTQHKREDVPIPVDAGPIAANMIRDLWTALDELVVSVERMADIGKRRERTVSPRMEEALERAKEVLR